MIPGISDWELLTIEKPARYVGGEWNQPPVKVNPQLSVCLAFPDLYELGMSNLGLRILYDRLARDERIQVERTFSPWVDFEQLLRRRGLPLFALESKRPVKNFDLLGITLPYEMTFTNVINLIDLAGLPLPAKDRTAGPLVIGGGPSASNPVPIAEFFDAVLIGDGEDAIIDAAELLLAAKQKGWRREEVLERLAAIDGYFVPRFPGPVRRRVFKGFGQSAPPLKPLISNIESVHDRMPLEIFRGCIQGCRFCNAGFFYRPKRERSVNDLCGWAQDILRATGEETLGLISLSTSDYSCLGELVDRLGREKKFPDQTLAVPSLRMNDQTLTLLERIDEMKKSGLTFAPEAGSQRLRDIIHKRITEEEILHVIAATKGSNYQSIKLYFMMGLPFETDADLDAIPELVFRIEDVCRRERLRKELTISLSGFVPKPFTPFQWSRQATPRELYEKRQRVCQGLKKSRARISWRDEFLCLLEGVLSRGDARVGTVLFEAWKGGATFDGWCDRFREDAWKQAFERAGVDANDYTREMPTDQSLPWEFIDFRTPRSYYLDEYHRAAALAEQKTVDACIPMTDVENGLPKPKTEPANG